MPGYVIADVTVTDPETYAGYRALTPGTIAAFGGRFLVRGGDHKVIEGAWTPGRLVLLAFDSPARAADWYDSPAYVEARAIRQRASTGSLVLLDGDAPATGAGGHFLIARHGSDGSGPDLAGATTRGGRILISARAPEVRGRRLVRRARLGARLRRAYGGGGVARIGRRTGADRGQRHELCVREKGVLAPCDLFS